jgi:hypothetical protein
MYNIFIYWQGQRVCDALFSLGSIWIPQNNNPHHGLDVLATTWMKLLAKNPAWTHPRPLAAEIHPPSWLSSYKESEKENVQVNKEHRKRKHSTCDASRLWAARLIPSLPMDFVGPKIRQPQVPSILRNNNKASQTRWPCQ